MRNSMLILVVGSLVVVSLLTVPDAVACQCVPDTIATPQDRLDSATSIYFGTVVEIEDSGCVDEFGVPLFKVFVDVSSVWRGEVFSRQLVMDSRHQCTIGNRYAEVGQSFYVLEDSLGGLLALDCFTLEDEEGEARYGALLGSGEAPLPGSSTEFSCEAPNRLADAGADGDDSGAADAGTAADGGMPDIETGCSSMGSTGSVSLLLPLLMMFVSARRRRARNH